MTTLSYTVPVAGSTLNSVADPEVATALNTILTWAAGGIDGTNVAATLTGRRKILEAYLVEGSGTGNNPFVATSAGDGVLSGNSAGRSPVFAYLDPSIYAVTGKSNTQLVIRLSVGTNATAPGINLIGQLNAITFAGGTGVIVPTIGAQSGTSATVTAPSGSSVAVAESTPFAFPVAGAYAAVFNFSGAFVANSLVAMHWELFVQNS